MPFTFSGYLAITFPVLNFRLTGRNGRLPSASYGFIMRSAKRFGILTGLMVLLLLTLFSFRASAEDKAPPPVDEHQRQLENVAKDSLRRLQYAIKKDGFYSARVALNIWRSTALEAGTFDAAQYEAFKTQIYETSMRENLKWFNLFVEQKNYDDARVCLELWRMHAREIGTYDPEEYEALKGRLQ